ncbi:uncharacterized protein [Cicer arietinum]|uniref:Uncharacterized protein LOC101495586 n=1 Tax=Cicer arietinum TaxID=3827 RepID=A0A1S2YMX4_CICAR|nr:uncharacterized protein LOC101495586 [Cicer arietinum]
MEENKKHKDSSSSFTSEVFGSKETYPSSSCGVFCSIFSSQSSNVVLRKESVRSEVISARTIKETWDSILGTKDGIPKGYGGESQKTNTLDMSFIYQDQRIEPCNLCSSINYGGRDIYPHYHSTQNDGRNSLPKNYGEVDDSGIDVRGDWWKGGAYY